MILQTIYEYRAFNYTHENSEYTLYIEPDKPMITFPEYELLTNFIDEMLNIVEQIPVFKGFKLHLTGCMRCKRTSEGKKPDPCERGKLEYNAAKSVVLGVCDAMVEGILESRKPQAD